jgi:hypothetical protein
MRTTANGTLEPKAWNLFVGAALVAGCGERTLPGDDETSTSEAPAADGGTESTTDTGGVATTETGTTETDTDYYEGCRTDDDCIGSAVCVAGICLPPQPCVYYWDCPEFHDCIEQGCQEVATPPPSCEFPEFDIPVALAFDGEPLTLAFADFDDDGQDELFVLSNYHLSVYEHGSNNPTDTTGCDFVGSYDDPDMAGGQFDDQPGEDIAVVFDDSVLMCFSDGIGGFASQGTDPSPLSIEPKVIAGDFDGQPPMDLVLHGTQTAALLLATGTVIPLDYAYFQDGATSAAAFGFDTAHAGVAVIEEYYDLYLFDLSGGIQVAQPNYEGNRRLTNITSPNAGRYVFTTMRYAEFDNEWYDVSLRDPISLDEHSHLVLSGGHVMVPGDFDGDQAQELFVTGDGALEGGPTSVVFGLFSEPCIAPQELYTESLVRDHAVGDHDGDGDDEVAFIFFDGTIVLVDVE